MIRFRDVLTVEDQEHIGKILRGDLASEPSSPNDLSSVKHFLRDQTFIDPSAVEAWKRLSRRDRERLISELIWRVTCHLDGSITRVLGVESYPLGKEFCAVQSEREGRGIFCVSLGE
jgi:hypothetical protein